MGEEIRREINQAPFVAVMVDETTDVGNTAQLALVQFEAYRKKFPDSAFSSLTQSHGSLFDDVTRLKTELIVMYAMADDEETQLARLSSLASMVIEKDLLLELKRTDVTLLYNRVIELFVNKEMRMGFVLK
ncbi:hypothetical protein VZT92_009362 [Zoarces viviparus]|uniref:DUF4371 domain-containing protein n=1 Tax=Zoarces viviparus TaxID=48416 RepID=A0AAW1FHQ7_ZOAVI